MYIKKNQRVTEDYKKIILGFVIVTVIIVVIIIYFSLGKAVIRVTPRAEIISNDFVVDVITDGGARDGVLQGVIYDSEVDGERIGQATGSKALAGDSIGTVYLINKRAEPQTLVKTTRLLTADGVLLRLVDRVNIPAGGEIQAAVYADDPNAFAELPPTKFIIPGLWEGLQTSIYAESREAIKSTGKSVKIIEEGDINKAEEDLKNELYSKAVAEFDKQLTNNNDYVVVVATNKVVSQELDSKVGEQKDSFNLKMKLSVTLIGLKKQDVTNLAGERLKTNVSVGQELLNVNVDKFTYAIQNFDEKNMTANIKVHVEGSTGINADSEIFDKEKLSGLSPKGVQLYLANFDGIDSVKVELSPFWVKDVPNMKDHIYIQIEDGK